MSLLAELALVFVAASLTDIATGLGVVPFYFFDEVSERWMVFLWGLAGGVMLSASTFGLLFEATAYGSLTEIGVGVILGVLLVKAANMLIEEHEFAPREIAEADFKKMALIVGVLTVHSFPEGVAVGVSFAEMSLGNGIPFFGFAVPVLAVFMTLAISVQNIPEGLAVSIPLKSNGYSVSTMFKVAVLSSAPQPLGAVLAYYFVVLARQFLPVGFGFAAGAMIYLVYSEMIPEALERGGSLGTGRKLVASGLLIGFLTMLPFQLL